MASGHVNRIKRPNTWLHRPMLQNVKKALVPTQSRPHMAHSVSYCGAATCPELGVNGK
jgi:hypothetical protein